MATGDHNLISFRLRIKGQDNRRLDETRRSYKIFNPETYKQELSKIDWDKITELKDVDLANHFLESNIVEILKQTMPPKNCPVQGTILIHGSLMTPKTK